jgi:DNA-binding transcriptional ArsR family regulator
LTFTLSYPRVMYYHRVRHWGSVPTSDDEFFRILADPTRRRILDLLADGGPRTVSELASEFPSLVPSGISKHLMSLRGAGLVVATRRGRQQIYLINGRALADGLVPWLAKYQPYWSDALDRLSAREKK